MGGGWTGGGVAVGEDWRAPDCKLWANLVQFQEEGSYALHVWLKPRQTDWTYGGVSGCIGAVVAVGGRVVCVCGRGAGDGGGC